MDCRMAVSCTCWVLEGFGGQPRSIPEGLTEEVAGDAGGVALTWLRRRHALTDTLHSETQTQPDLSVRQLLVPTNCLHFLTGHAPFDNSQHHYPTCSS